MTAWFIAVLLVSVGVSVIRWFWCATVAYLISSRAHMEYQWVIADEYKPYLRVQECRSCGAPVQPNECACSYCRSVP